MSMTRRRGLRFGVGGLLIVGLIAVVRPWTIRPIETAPGPRFDAASYVESSWARLLAEADGTARDVAAVFQTSAPDPGAADAPPARQSLFVRGAGVVTRVDVESRAGQALVRIDGTSPPVAVVVQVGPVLRGTALRDAASFIRFTDFANQFDFAAVSNAMNERVLATVLGHVDRQALSGERVSFVGAATVRRQGAETSVEIVPVTLSVGRGNR
jgi:predicted lipoprotein